MVSVNGKAGYETHAYYDGSTLAKGSATKAPFQFGVSATRVATGGRLSGTLSYNHQEAYLDGAGSQKTQTLCPGGATGVLACVTGFIGAPKRQQQELLAAGVRYIGETPWGLPIGVGPSVTYETRSKAYAVQVPIYLVADKDKNLTGGIRYDWTSDTHHSTVGIFLTSAFSVLP
jgi:outer membrane receptor protein involved in Fe transport